MTLKRNEKRATIASLNMSFHLSYAHFANVSLGLSITDFVKFVLGLYMGTTNELLELPHGRLDSI